MTADHPSDRKEPAPISMAEFTADPHGTLARHRRAHWYATFAGSNFVEVLEYGAVRELLARDSEFAGYVGGYINELLARNPNIPPELAVAMSESSARGLVNLDGERHHRLRSLVSRAFTPRSVTKLQPFLASHAERLARELQPGDDFMHGFARDFPALALCELTGIPAEDHDDFIAWIDVLEVALKPSRLSTMDRAESERVLETQRKLETYSLALVHERRANPGDDLVSGLVREAAGEFDDETVAGLIFDLVFAGNDTTRNALGLMVMKLTEHPEIWERVAREPEYARAVVEESLRYESPAPGPVRCPVTDVTYRDRDFVAGQVLALSTWSANRDETVFGPDAAQFNPDRSNAGDHLAFGHGPHFCLGASLAREELRAALVALTHQVTGVQLLHGPPMHTPGSIYGPIELRIDFQRRA